MCRKGAAPEAGGARAGETQVGGVPMVGEMPERGMPVDGGRRPHGATRASKGRQKGGTHTIGNLQLVGTRLQHAPPTEELRKREG